MSGAEFSTKLGEAPILVQAINADFNASTGKLNRFRNVEDQLSKLLGNIDRLRYREARGEDVKAELASRRAQVRASTTTILGYFSGARPDSNEICCMLNHQRRHTLPRLTAAPTTTSSVCCLTLQFLWRPGAQDARQRHRAERGALRVQPDGRGQEPHGVYLGAQAAHEPAEGPSSTTRILGFFPRPSQTRMRHAAC